VKTADSPAPAVDEIVSVAEVDRLVSTLYPICRSISGDGVRRSLEILREIAPLEIREVPSGTPAFDWTVPKEWNIRDAYVRRPDGETVIEFDRSNLHVVGYSTPVHKRVSLDELKAHTFTLPDRPQWIPYRTSYYKEDWGFCMSHDQLQSLPEGEYDVRIDSSLEDGHLTYGECFLQGAGDDEILVSAHICHPSLANDNLSGLAVAAFLARHVNAAHREGSRLRYSYRFLFIPGTIGSITWLAQNESRVASIKHGFVLAGVGDSGAVTYKRSRRGDAEIDRTFAHVVRARGGRTIDFHPYGYDERQFCSPGFDLPVGCMMRTPFGEYPEYHTSADDLSFLSREAIVDSVDLCTEVLDVLENNRTYLNRNPKCEPRLGKHGLYRAVGGETHTRESEMALLWVLNLSDGTHTLLDIAERSGCRFGRIREAAMRLTVCGLLERSDRDSRDSARGLQQGHQ
jgi:aminopeptidase-like protein